MNAEDREQLEAAMRRIVVEELDTRDRIRSEAPPALSLAPKKFDSLVPMNEEQLAILRRSEQERKTRAEADRKWREYRRIILALLGFLTICMQVVFEALRSMLAHGH